MEIKIRWIGNELVALATTRLLYHRAPIDRVTGFDIVGNQVIANLEDRPNDDPNSSNATYFFRSESDSAQICRV